MDVDEALVVMYYYLRRKRRKTAKERKYWVHPILRERFSLGTFQNLITELRSDEIKFFNYFRMSITTFNHLLAQISVSINYQNTRFRDCICTEERLAIFLRYCASGCSFKELHYSYRVGVSTISKICKEISSTIWDVLRDEFMQIPDNERKWLEIAKSFDMKANFPHCLGAVDAVVDSEYRFIFMSVGSYGKECDSSIFKESTIWKKLNDGSLNIPKPRPLHATLQNDMPYVLVGDEAFPLSTNLLRPFGGTHLDHMKKIFNYRLSRARRYVECAFGILANKWRIFHRPLDVHPDTAIEIVKACTVLHNFVREKDGLNFEDIHYAAENPMQEQVQLQNCNPRGGPIANDIRSEFANYFVSTIGSVPWQPEAHG
ncbi:uncharacterized protein LOC118271408 isoform X2 [Spodoptera frugiperda]|uniref:Uncharacterized protein LOC118264249 isoform X2 n=1 Tax=Spodoptera frugiperda TaxID=7108 RepID=A0A9R0EGY8_SPOFR|nr:uncharacterized protein LOC118264249 isoform X2 [Spodoptera frugiperda]XP_035443389.2 uncharacterized protein LOC118271408 isoform X2 [Spodoptera frugiperda]